MKAYDDGQARFYAGDVRAVLRELPANSVHCCVTSPPYWSLRDYGTPGQLGLEATPEEYIANMVDVFREVRRVLHKDGTLWLNIGDSYAGAPVGTFNGGGFKDASAVSGGRDLSGIANGSRLSKVVSGLKPKDLVGIPWMLAFALRADGWWLRQDIIWAKPNPMPESVTDRCTKAHEYVFLLSKSARYYYDADAVREAAQDRPQPDPADKTISPNATEWLDNRYAPGASGYGHNPAGRNKRSVWTIATESFPESHFATFPQALVKPCILAGTSDHGVCSECGAPWARVTDKVGEVSNGGYRKRADAPGAKLSATSAFRGAAIPVMATTGWAPTCKHEAPVVPATVLDPFLGSGTTAMVAKALGRHAIGIDLNPTYLAMAAKRCAQMGLM